MNIQTLKQIIYITSMMTTLMLLSSCGTSKSSHGETVLSSVTSTPSQKILTSCHKSSVTDMSLNISAVKNIDGAINPNIIKIKFNRLSAVATQSGNIIRFFKWKVNSTEAYLDPANLPATRYDLASGNIDDQTKTSLQANEITNTKGYYLELNDSAGVYQVLKAVVYSSSGTIVTQMNILIPQFLATPADYATNTDGSPRAQILQDLHPLENTNTSGWSTQNFVDYYKAFCF